MRKKTKAKYGKLKFLRFLIEGDSWAAMPRNWLMFGPPANISGYIARYCASLKNISSCGDELSGVYSGRMKFRDHLADHDICILSAGGNDVAGLWDFHRLVYDSGQEGWKTCIDHKKLEKKMQLIRLCVEEIAEMAEASSRYIVMHTYDIPFPRQKGASFLNRLIKVEPKGWLDQYMPARLSPDEKREIVRYILAKFAETLKSCETKYFRVCDTQGTLSDVSLWRDEMHPTPKGMEMIAGRIMQFIEDEICPSLNR